MRDDLPNIGQWYLDYVLRHHYAPTIRELCKKWGIRSTSTGQQVVQALIARGYINGAMTR